MTQKYRYYKLKQLTHDLVVVAESHDDAKLFKHIISLMDYIAVMLNASSPTHLEAPALVQINQHHATLANLKTNAPKRV